MNISRLKAIIIILIIVLVIGCDDSDTDTEVSRSPYMGGSKGIIAEFYDMGIYNEQSKINEIYEDESFPIEILLKNKGEYDVGSGDVEVTLKGIYLPSFSGIVDDGQLENDDEIEGVDEDNEDGGEETLDFTPGTDDAEYEVDFSGASVDLDLFAEVVFDYKTFVTVKKVCFKEDLQDDSICEVSESKKVFSSGAPIQANNAEESTAGSAKIAVEIDVENVGGGDVAIPNEDFDNRHDMFAFEPSKDKWECRSSGKLNEGRFDSAGKAKIICKLTEPLEEDELYTEDLELEIEYKYKYLIQESVRIKEE